MKKIYIVLLLSVFVACKKEADKKGSLYPETAKKPEELGKEIFEGKGMCYSCHLTDKKTIGPSIQEISKTYRNKKGNIVAFLQEKAEPIVDPSQYAIMKTNFAITKNLPESELNALEVYILSH
jgi:cytochrome c